ncbi:Hpt domain-containing protein [Pseudomonas sp. 21LCFQ010]|uniref:Hpt domain-containing protein n=1 Tax=Pseudomonas sp. 21LCFQ010 TaxID=2957506 RepID=UPI002097A3D0|nr:Hpt domain-containing protein [Pseudomonas sp. 21LCFQ010]MCO8163403.1 Hpt domain-containing protein [Pseudomonas sp. 21LCFQ010]
MEDEYLTLIDVFLSDSEQRLALLRQAARNLAGGTSPDLTELGLAAHSFKGSSSNMGALRLSELCRQLEEQARRQVLDGLEELVSLIDSEYQAIRQVFNAERQVLVAQT